MPLLEKQDTGGGLTHSDWPHDHNSTNVFPACMDDARHVELLLPVGKAAVDHSSRDAVGIILAKG